MPRRKLNKVSEIREPNHSGYCSDPGSDDEIPKEVHEITYLEDDVDLSSYIHQAKQERNAGFDRQVYIDNMENVSLSYCGGGNFKTLYCASGSGYCGYEGHSKIKSLYIDYSDTEDEEIELIDNSKNSFVNTPGKIAKPRQLHNIEWEKYIPTETLEIKAVGVPKNLASTMLKPIPIKCKFMNTVRGCRSGADCKFDH